MTTDFTDWLDQFSLQEDLDALGHLHDAVTHKTTAGCFRVALKSDMLFITADVVSEVLMVASEKARLALLTMLVRYKKDDTLTMDGALYLRQQNRKN